MSTLPLYPLDLTATALSNKITGEIKNTPTEASRVFIPTAGPFYTKSLKVYAGNTLLAPVRDYKALELNRDGTIASGKEVCNVLLITHQATSFRLEYQVIGGEYSDLTNELSILINDTPINKLKILTWGSILNKPTSFPPTAHKHYPYEWRGYTNVIHLLEQIRLAVIAGDSTTVASIYNYIDNNTKNITSEYIEANGLLFIDKTPTSNGNVLLEGLGTQGSPLGIDLSELLDELDNRYFRNVINPLTRIGAISDNFLPISSGFFNCLCPIEETLAMSIVGHVERNGDLLFLSPATNGEIIRYVYGYVRGWSNVPDIRNFKPTNIQYRPPGLAGNEEIVDLFGYHEQSMIGTIHTVNTDGTTTFKEHVIIWLNGTMIAESHSVVRIGNALRTAAGTTNQNTLKVYYPHVAKLRNGDQFLTLYKGLNVVDIFKFNESAKTFNKVTNWTGKIQQNTIDPITDLTVDNIISTTETQYVTGQDQPMPFYWFKDERPVGDTLPFVMEEDVTATNPAMTYEKTITTQRTGKSIRVVGNTIKLMAMSQYQYFVRDAGLYRGGQLVYLNFSMELNPLDAVPTFKWVRHKRDNETFHSSGTNNSTGVVTIHDTGTYYLAPRDVISYYANPVEFSRFTRLQLNDGSFFFWRHPSFYGIPIFLSSYGNNPNRVMKGSIDRLFISYFQMKYFANPSYGSNSVIGLGMDKLNFPSPTLNDIQTQAIPFPSGAVLHHDRTADPRGVTHLSWKMSAYKPSAQIINYNTATNGTIQGYNTTNNRIELVGDYNGLYDGMPFIGAKFGANQTKVGSPVWWRPIDGIWVDQTTYLNIDINWTTRQFTKTEARTFTRLGFNAVEDFVTSKLSIPGATLIDYSWTIIASPTDPAAAMLWYEGNTSDNYFREGMAAVKLTFDGSGFLTSLSIDSANNFLKAPLNVIPVGVTDPRRAFGRLTWAIDVIDADTSYWIGKAPNGTTHFGDTLPKPGIYLFRQTKNGAGLPIFEHLATQGVDNGPTGTSGYKSIVATKLGVGMMTDTVGYGVFRALRRIKTSDYVSGDIFADEDPFIWTTPRPPALFDLTVSDVIEVQLGGVYGQILPSTYSLTDPLISDVVDARNKTIYIYATLELGVPKLIFREVPLAESIYVTFIGKCRTDNYGVLELDVQPLTRLGNYRPSATPQGSAFSVSSGTADQQQLLNWDANVFGSDGTVDDGLLEIASGSTPGEIYGQVIQPGEKYRVLLISAGGGGGAFRSPVDGTPGGPTRCEVHPGTSIVYLAGGGGGTWGTDGAGARNGSHGAKGAATVNVGTFSLSDIRIRPPVRMPSGSFATPGLIIPGQNYGYGGSGMLSLNDDSSIGYYSGNGAAGHVAEFTIGNDTDLPFKILIILGSPGISGSGTFHGGNGYYSVKRFI